jgi:hypothetical protein
MRPKEALMNMANGIGESMGLLTPKEIYYGVGQAALAECTEDPELAEYQKGQWAFLNGTTDFVNVQAERLQEAGGAAASFAGRALGEKGYKDVELWTRAVNLRYAMADKFLLYRQDLNLIVSTNERGAGQLVIMYTGSEGLAVPDTYSLSGKDRSGAYSIELGDETLDTRSGMTWQTYKDFVSAEIEGGAAVPDASNPIVLTGEPKYMGSLLVAKAPFRKSTPIRDYEWRYSADELRFRPGVVVGLIGETETPADKMQEAEDLELAA